MNFLICRNTGEIIAKRTGVHWKQAAAEFGSGWVTTGRENSGTLAKTDELEIGSVSTAVYNSLSEGDFI